MNTDKTSIEPFSDGWDGTITEEMISEAPNSYGYPAHDYSTHAVLDEDDDSNTCPYCKSRGALTDIQPRHHYASHVCGTEFSSKPSQRTAQCYVIATVRQELTNFQNLFAAQLELTEKLEQEGSV